MALKSSDPKENDKILKKKIFHHFGGLRAPQNLKMGGLEESETPQN